VAVRPDEGVVLILLLFSFFAFSTPMLIRFIALLLITVTSAVIHGQLTYRWGIPADLQQSADFVKSTPKQLGTWKYVEDAKPMTKGVIEELGVTDYVSRVYTNGTDTVTLLLMAGKTGRLVRHTPDICYGATGNTFLKEPTPVSLDVDGKSHEFRVLPIRPSSDLSGDFVVVYGFAHDGQFLSPANPRLIYHGLPGVEKIQVLCKPDPETPGEKPDPEKLVRIPEYAKTFVQEVCRYMQTSQTTP
jgi:hypothetical protein